MTAICGAADAAGTGRPCWEVCVAAQLPGCRSLAGIAPPGKASTVVLACHSPTQPLQRMGYPCLQTAFHHLLYIFCSSRAHSCWPSVFQGRIRPTAWPHTVTNLGWPEPHQPLPTAGSESCSLLHSYLLLIFCCFQNFSCGYLLIFQYKECSCSQCRVKWEIPLTAQRCGPKICRGVSRLVSIIINFVVLSAAALTVLCKTGLRGYLCFTE